MKKLTFPILAASAVMLVACSNEDQMPIQDGEGYVTFSVSAPEVLTSRAIGEGATANDLRVVVFDENGQHLFTDEYQNFFATQSSGNVQVKLVSGETYTVAFWVDDEFAYTINPDGVVDMGYDHTPLGNADNRDAFFASRTLTVSATTLNQSVSLTRPFAQINLGTADYDAAVAVLSKDLVKSTVILSGAVYNQLNLCGGEVAGEPLSQVEFSINAHPDEVLTANGSTYVWLGMNYVLVDKSGSTFDVAMNLFDGDGNQAYPNQLKYYSVPAKRNFRTNIVGNLLTSTTDWELNIDSQPTGDLIQNVEELINMANTAGATLGLPSETLVLPSNTIFAENVTLKGNGPDQTVLKLDVNTTNDGLKLTQEGISFSQMTIDGTAVPSAIYSSAINVKADNCEISDCVIVGGGRQTWSSSVLVTNLTEGQSFKISNCNISGAFRGILAESQKGDIYVDNCDIIATYPISIDGGGNFGLYVTNSSLHGWTSYSKITEGAHFTNCIFTKSTGDNNNIAAYCDTYLTNCEFSSDFDLYAQVADFTFTLENCTKGGVAVTADNFKDLFPADPDVWNKCTLIVNGVTVAPDPGS